MTGMSPDIEIREKYDLIIDNGTVKKGGASKEGDKYIITFYYSDYFKKGDEKPVLIHELIHIWQMEQGKLIPLAANKVVWKGDTIRLADVPYFDRPFEVEAKKMEDILIQKL